MRAAYPVLVRWLSGLIFFAFAAGALAQEQGEQGSSGSDTLDKPVVAGFDEVKDEPDVEATEAAPEAKPPGPGPQRHPPLRFYSASPGAESGLIRVKQAFAGPPMSMRLSVHGSFLTSDTFLKYDSELTDYSESHFTGRLGLSFTPIEYVEAFLSLHSSSNKNSHSQPGLLQTQGDVELGAKGMYQLLPYLGLGLDAAVAFSNGIGEVTPAFDGTNFRTSLLVSFDARPLMRELPLRAHLNAGIILENTDSLRDGRELTWIEQYALGVNSFHRVALGLGLEAPLAYLEPVGITPFVEYTVEIPLGLTDEDLANSSLGLNATLADILPMRLTPGLRLTYLTDVTLDVALDIGIGGEKAYIDGVPAVAPWRVWVGLTYAFDPTRRSAASAPEPALLVGRVTNRTDAAPLGGAIISFAGTGAAPVASHLETGRYLSRHEQDGEVLVTCAKEGFVAETRKVALKAAETVSLDFSLEAESKKEGPPPQTTGRVVGRVVNSTDQMPIPFAIITFDGAGLTPVATDELEGKYASYEMQPGVFSLTAMKAGFKPQTQQAEVKVSETTILDFTLEADRKQGTLSGTVTNEKDKPMLAKVQIDGPQQVDVNTAEDTGAFSAQVPAGSYAIKVSADGYLAKGRRFDLKENQSLVTEFKLSPRPKKVVVVLNKKKKKIAVKKKIHFASGRTRLRVDASQILDGVIDVLINHPEIKRVRIEGHTDSVGSAKLNRKLSQGRAEAVLRYLIEQGISSDTLEARGYGESRPIAPNSTRRGREQNRRVEFTIIEP